MVVASLDEAKVLLYGEPQDTFVSARDGLVKQLRQAKERELALAVKALRKPSAVAAEVNRVVRADPAGVELLLQAAELLRAAQAGALGDGIVNVSDLQRQYRAAIKALSQIAESRTADVRAALEAATIDIDSNEALRTGSLVVVPEPVSVFGNASVSADTPDAPTDELAARRAKRQSEAAAKQAESGRQATSEAKQAKKRLVQERAERKKQLKALTKQHRQALRSQLDALDVESEAINAVEQASAQIEELDGEITDVQQQIADLNESLAALVEQRQQADDEHRAVAAEVAPAEQRAAEAACAVQALADAIATLEAEIEALA